MFVAPLTSLSKGLEGLETDGHNFQDLTTVQATG